MARVGWLGPDLARDVAAEVLSGVAEVVDVPLDADALAAALPDLDAVVDASTRVPVGAAAIAAAPRLRMLSLASTGSSHVDEDAAAAHGVAVRTLREDRDLLADLTPAAEHTWALLLAVARRLPAAAAHARGGGWAREGFPSLMLRGRTLGVVGLGRIGGHVARYGAAFGMEVVAHDPVRTDWPDGVRRAGLDEVLAASDVVTVHVHLDDATRGLLDADALARCRPGAVVINTSRGGVLDDAAAVALVRSGHLGGLGLDVLTLEPPDPDHPVLVAARELDTVVVTPHVGGFSPDAVRLVVRRAAEKVRDALAGATDAELSA